MNISQTSLIYFNLVLEIRRNECLRKANMWISLAERTVANCNKCNEKKKMSHMVSLNESHTTVHSVFIARKGIFLNIAPC